MRDLPRTYTRRAFVALLTAIGVVCVLIAAQAPAAPVAAQTALPPLPAGWPSTLQLGMSDGPGGAATMRGTAPFGFRYQYLAGGVNTGGGWSTWNPNGDFATYYIQDSVQHGITPVFTYYQIRQSAPNQGQGDGDADFNNLQNSGTMSTYFNDVKLFMQKAGAFPQTKVVLHVEPDLWGFLEQRATNDDATTVPAQVASTGMPELAGLPNNASGLARAIVHLRDLYAPNVFVAYHLSVWGTGNDILYSKPDNTTVTNLATRAATFYQSLQAPFDITFAEYSDRDAAFKQYQYGDGGASWWGAADYQRNELFISRFVSLSQRRVVFWQIPVGNTRMQAENNTWDHYQDNHVEWLLDDPSRTNLNAYLQAGVVAYLFGGGGSGTTCACDAAGDGVTNPPPINGNTRPSLSADDDGGFFRDRTANYYTVGAMPLPGSSGGGAPTNTPTPLATNTSTSVPTSTPTPRPTSTTTPTPVRTATPTSTATPGGGTTSQTVTFDDLSSPDRPLSGQYPSGLINWGTNVWYLSSPWGRFTTNSISFNGDGPTSASFSFVAPHRLLRLDAYNGGSGATTVTVACSGQPTVTTTLGAGQVTTLATNWTATCTTVTIGSSNGWWTNFDNLVVQ